MGDQGNYAALDWVLGEIGETLNEARQALEAYVEQPRDLTQLRFCITHIHQVRGSLNIVEFHGATLLAEEMENLAQALMNQNVSSVTDAQEVLMRSLLQLPIYLDHVKVYRDDTARTILPLLNDIRALRKESYLTESNLFTPDLKALKTISGQRHPALQDHAKLKQVTTKLREMYQFAAASVLRNIKVNENLAYLEKVFARLVVLTSGTASAPLWRVSAALVEGLKSENIELSIAVKGLLRYLARELRLLSEKAPAAFDRPVPEGLVKNLLYYIASSEASTPLTAQIKEEFRLDHSSVGTNEQHVDGYNVNSLDPDAVRSVVKALREELKSIKSKLDTALTTQIAPQELGEILPVVKRVADTLAVLGIRELREVMLLQAEFLSDLSKRNSLDESGLMESAGHIIDVDSKLEAISKAVDKHRDLASINERAIEIDEAKLAVLKECQIGLEKVKEAIIEYISSQWDVSQLTNIGQLLNDIRGGLDMIPLPRAGVIITLCSRYITEQLVEKNQEPNWTSLDSLADTMASIEYFLERLSNDMTEDAESLLDMAEKSIASLGYPVEDSSTLIQEPAEPLVDEAQAGNQQPQDVEQPHDVGLQDASHSRTDTSHQDRASSHADDNAVNDLGQNFATGTGVIDSPPAPNDTNEQAPVEAEAPIPKLDSIEEESDIDDEIIEIFIEEANEVFETLEQNLPAWLDNQDQEALTVVRRAYHTLKGSGRMVEAMDIGEFAWAVENMLNRVIDGSVEYDQAHGQLVRAVTSILPAMVNAFEHRQPNPEKERVEILSRWAFLLAEGTVPHDFDASIMAANKVEHEPGPGPGPEPEPEPAQVPDAIAVEPALEQALGGGAKEDDSAEDDQVLLEIFSSEVETHLGTIRDFVAQMEAEAPIYSPPSDELQRALHTLKGSAKMAQVTPIAQMYEVLESFAKEMVTFQVVLSEDVLQLVRDAVSYTETCLQQIEARQTVHIPRLEQFLARTAELREINVGHLVRMKEQQKDGETPVDPRLLSIFMAEEMNLLLDADEIVQSWCQGLSDASVINNLVKELDTLAVGADQAKLPDMSELALKLKSIYTHLLAEPYCPDEVAKDHLLTGHAALLDMVDAVAAGQNVQAPPDGLSAQLDGFANTLSNAAVASDQSRLVDESQDQPYSELQGHFGEHAEHVNQTEAVAESESESESAENIDSSDHEHVESLYDDQDEPVETLSSQESELPDVVFEQHDVRETEGIDQSTSSSDLPEENTQVSEIHDAPADIIESEQATPTDGLLDAIDTEEEDFDLDILEVFLEEADELFEELDESIHSWESDGDASALEEMKRALHTMKGGARLSGMPVLGDLVHDYESFLISSGSDTSNEATLAKIHGYQDKMYKAVAAVKQFLGTGDTTAVVDEDAAATIPTASDEDFHAAPQPPVHDVSDGESSTSNNVVPFVSKPKIETPAESADAPGMQEAVVAAGGAAAAVAKKSGPQEVVRINSELLEELVNLAGETSISRSRLEEQVTEFRHSLDEVDSTIDRLQEQLRRLDIETEAQVLFRQEQMAVHEENFDPLEMDRYSHLQQLSRSLMESASDLYDLRSDLSNKVKDAETTLLQQSRINTTLQEGLMRSRMVPFSRLVPRLRRIVRQVASELGKKVSFELDNVEGELDRNVLERMVPPFEHMLRNAVDHGIESPEERIANGKPESGRIVLTLTREGGNVAIRLADDGRGVDLQRVRNKAIERGLMDSNANLSDHDVMQFILHAGFSTAENVTQISGRGVGMDVVNAEIKQLGGDVTINSQWGQGTEFVIHLPFTLSVNRALMVEIGKDQYAIPLNTIEGIVRVSPFELDHYYNHPETEFEYANDKFKVRYLGSLLHAGRKANLEGHILPLPVVLVRSAQHTMALQVDALMGSREIVVKSLGVQFSTVQGLSGATIMGDGSVVVILDPHALVRQEIAKADLLLSAADRAQQELMEDTNVQAEAEVVKTVMVVDDSVTVRKVTTRFLEREGFNVITAKDGADALQVLQDETPDIMLLDIEMPRMDGFEVAKNLRTSSRWKSLPIIMITSRTGDKHREHALSLGVNHYMGKPYQEDNLLETIEELTLTKTKA